MTVRKVSQNEVLQDIRSGMDETAIRQKYKLSSQGLKKLYERLIEAGLLGSDLKPVERRINMGRILADIRAGMSDSDLMTKHGLSREMLRQVSKRLLEARGKKSTVDKTETVIEEPPEFLATGEFLRHEVDFELLIYEASRPEIQGTVRDVSEDGVGVSGIEAKPGELKTLVVLGDDLDEFSSFEFEGFCRWCVDDPANGTCLTGFAVNKISDDDLRELRKLVRLVAVGA